MEKNTAFKIKPPKQKSDGKSDGLNIPDDTTQMMDIKERICMFIWTQFKSQRASTQRTEKRRECPGKNMSKQAKTWEEDAQRERKGEALRTEQKECHSVGKMEGKQGCEAYSH